MNRIQILMYHQVGDFPAMDTHRATYCDHRRFAVQMGYLKAFGYNVLSMNDVLQCVRGDKPIPPRAVAITFDDAYENFYEYALPILQRHGFPATVYAIAGMLGGSADWLIADGHDAPPLMGAARLRELLSHGIEVGSHSFNHIRLGEQPAELAFNEALKSKSALEDALGRPVDHFCYPYGSHNLQTVEAVAEAGYKTAVTCERAPATIGDDPLTLPRKAVAWGDSLVGVWWKMHMKNVPKRPLIRR